MQTQSLAKYCVKDGCPNTHIHKRVCSVLSSHLFLVFGSNLAFAKVVANKASVAFLSVKREESIGFCRNITD